MPNRFPRGKGMPEPLHPFRTLGLKMDKAALGWILLENKKTAPKAMEEAFGDPVKRSVDVWLAQPEPRPEVDLYIFATEQDFAGSRFDCEGGDYHEHQRTVMDTAAALREARAQVRFRKARAIK